MVIQQQVYDAVERRGYREGWTSEQFAARQVAKLAEKLGELARVVIGGGSTGFHRWCNALCEAAQRARQSFDELGPEWWGATPTPEARDELADIQVIVFCLAETLAEIDGAPFDVAQAALEKAKADVERGIR